MGIVLSVFRHFNMQILEITAQAMDSNKMIVCTAFGGLTDDEEKQFISYFKETCKCLSGDYELKVEKKEFRV